VVHLELDDLGLLALYGLIKHLVVNLLAVLGGASCTLCGLLLDETIEVR
jgi:hypothetical protein